VRRSGCFDDGLTPTGPGTREPERADGQSRPSGTRREATVTIRQIVESDRSHWVRLRDALWPGSVSDHEEETRRFFEERLASLVVFVAEVNGQLVGFLELDFRRYAPGCSASPVAFIEGWYVEPALQKQGVGRALMYAAHAHARAAGHHEIASDAEIENAEAIAAHRALGYEEIERVVCFRRSLAVE
jgi:aminoglycoside 6'-N-acetyltransferase I